MARRSRREEEYQQKLDMTPLIDAVFLLIMFFILTSQITVDVEEVALPFGLEGKSDEGGNPDTVVVLNVRLATEQNERGDGEIVYRGEVLTPKTLRETLQNEVDFDASELGRGRTPEVEGQNKLSQVKVRIRADKLAKAEYVREIFQACAEVNPKIYKVEVSVEQPSSN
ncbi:MAG TPA: biopolymer transporter ExbD [Planctomycetota bacterium]|nr:biopolymer transporter ExbD [Planctomycetota bacterium]